MSDHTDGVGSRPTRMSAWPPFVALGFAISEVGVFLNVPSVAVGGILLFGGSIAGILVDASFTTTPWPSLGVVGAGFTALGAVIWGSQVQTYALGRLLAVAQTNGVAMRGEAVLVAGVLLLVGTVAGIVLKPLYTTI
ncbi:MAG: cox cluster protein [Halanaeroarchaeum sp.]